MKISFSVVLGCTLKLSRCDRTFLSIYFLLPSSFPLYDSDFGLPSIHIVNMMVLIIIALIVMSGAQF
jgi:hypothetical protein